MPTFRQRFTGAVEEHFPEPPICRLVYPGDVVEYDADEAVQHARLEDADQPEGWVRFPHHVEGHSAVYRRPVLDPPVEIVADESGPEVVVTLRQPTRPPKTADAKKEE